MSFLLLLGMSILAMLPLRRAITCLSINVAPRIDNSAIMIPMPMSCTGQQCYSEVDDTAQVANFFRGCISGVDMKDGCLKYAINGYTVVRCYCRSTNDCNSADLRATDYYPMVNTTALQCARGNQHDYCSSHECLYVGNARKCQNAVDDFTPDTSWLGYLWQNTCLHHRGQTGLIESDCRCNTNKCNENLPALAETLAINETYRDRPLVKCHYSFASGGMASDKYFCIGELCALSEGKGVRTCVNVTDLGGAELIKNLGFFDFDNRTYYLCDKPFCNWNGSIALASLNASWTPKNDTNLIPFEQNSGSYLPLFVMIFLSVLMLNPDF